jgi:hypothetical protein
MRSHDAKLKASFSAITPDDLEGRYPLDQHPNGWINGPGHLLDREYQIAPWRSQWQDAQKSCLIHVMGPGEDRDDLGTTRIGGTPYWPRQIAWPTTQAGKRLQFVAQLDFRGIDWPDPLPGDILSIHADEELADDEGFADSDILRLTWLQYSSQTDVLANDEIPEGDDCGPAPGPFHMERVLAKDYWFPREVRESLDEDFDIAKPDLILDGVKIGGHSPVSEEHTAYFFARDKPWTYLASVYGAWPIEGQMPEVWLPGRDGHTLLSVREFEFGILRQLVLAYPNREPDKLKWILFLY